MEFALEERFVSRLRERTFEQLFAISDDRSCRDLARSLRKKALESARARRTDETLPEKCAANWGDSLADAQPNIVKAANRHLYQLFENF